MVEMVQRAELTQKVTEVKPEENDESRKVETG
jgi:hypothetical protein